MCGQVDGHELDSVVVTGILPVFALLDFFVMWTNMTGWMLGEQFTLKGNGVLAELNRK